MKERSRQGRGLGRDLGLLEAMPLRDAPPSPQPSPASGRGRKVAYTSGRARKATWTQDSNCEFRESGRGIREPGFSPTRMPHFAKAVRLKPDLHEAAAQVREQGRQHQGGVHTRQRVIQHYAESAFDVTIRP